MDMKLKPLNIFLYLSLICIGIVIGIAIRHYANLPLAESFNIMDLATLVTTIFLAVYIPEVLDREQQVTKDKKHLIGQRVEDLQALCRKINMLVQSDLYASPRSILIVNNTLDVTKGKIATIRSLLANAGLKSAFTNELNNIESLCEKHRQLLWMDERDMEGFTYSFELQEQEEILYNKIDAATSLLIFKISEI